MLSLARAADGDHRLTLTVSPENLGPVTVRAHISGATIRIELQAPGDLGREALRAILSDLRRDLAAAAPQATLSLASTGTDASSSQGAPTGGQSALGGQAERQAPGPRAQPTAPSAPPGPQVPPTPTSSPHGGVDVYA